MTTTVHTTTTARSGTGSRWTGRGWAAAGVLAGAAGITSIQASTAVDALHRQDGDAEGVVAALAQQVPQILVFHTATTVATVLLLVVAAGLHRRLARALPADSLLPAVAAGGLGLVAVAGLIGSGLDTEFVFGLQDPSVLVPEAAVLFAHWVGTVPWLWVGSGVAALAVAVAALRHRALPRWIGWVSLVLGVLTTLVGISPLQYMAGFPGPVWLLVASLGFLLGDRAADRAPTGA
ncbi:hypothetical protein NUM3379_39660 [Kineococcus sp. NUM-3379]